MTNLFTTRIGRIAIVAVATGSAALSVGACGAGYKVGTVHPVHQSASATTAPASSSYNSSGDDSGGSDTSDTATTPDTSDSSTSDTSDSGSSGSSSAGSSGSGPDCFAANANYPVIQGDKSGMSFKGQNLACASLDTGDYSYADFSGVDLQGATLSGLNLTGANFTGANLDNATFLNDTGTDVTFDRANLNALGTDGSDTITGSFTDTTCPDGTVAAASQCTFNHD